MICNRDTSGADKEECSCELHGIRGGAKSLELHPVPLPFGTKEPVQGGPNSSVKIWYSIEMTVVDTCRKAQN